MKVNENVCLPLKENSSAVKTETETEINQLKQYEGYHRQASKI